MVRPTGRLGGLGPATLPMEKGKEPAQPNPACVQQTGRSVPKQGKTTTAGAAPDGEGRGRARGRGPVRPASREKLRPGTVLDFTDARKVGLSKKQMEQRGRKRRGK